MCQPLRIATGSLQSSNKLAAPGVFENPDSFWSLEEGGNAKTVDVFV